MFTGPTHQNRKRGTGLKPVAQCSRNRNFCGSDACKSVYGLESEIAFAYP